jgi:hypothetical protein
MSTGFRFDPQVQSVLHSETAATHLVITQDEQAGARPPASAGIGVNCSGAHTAPSPPLSPLISGPESAGGEVLLEELHPDATAPAIAPVAARPTNH